VTFVLSSNNQASTKIIMELSDNFCVRFPLLQLLLVQFSFSQNIKNFKCVRPVHSHNVGIFLIHKYLNFHKACSTVSLILPSEKVSNDYKTVVLDYTKIMLTKMHNFEDIFQCKSAGSYITRRYCLSSSRVAHDSLISSLLIICGKNLDIY
jgi:hypothetical protein